MTLGVLNRKGGVNKTTVCLIRQVPRGNERPQLIGPGSLSML